jgi:hypothetical protein
MSSIRMIPSGREEADSSLDDFNFSKGSTGGRQWSSSVLSEHKQKVSLGGSKVLREKGQAKKGHSVEKEKKEGAHEGPFLRSRKASLGRMEGDSSKLDQLRMTLLHRYTVPRIL